MLYCTNNHSNQVLEAFLVLFLLGGEFVSTMDQYSIKLHQMLVLDFADNMGWLI